MQYRFNWLQFIRITENFPNPKTANQQLSNSLKENSENAYSENS